MLLSLNFVFLTYEDIKSIPDESEAFLPKATLELITIVLGRSKTIKIAFGLLNSSNQFCL